MRLPEKTTSPQHQKGQEARLLTLLTGPPALPAMDYVYVKTFMTTPGKKVICGSTTLQIVSREWQVPVSLVNLGTLTGSPPEYRLSGVDLAAEGTILLNQVCCQLAEPPESISDNAPDASLAGRLWQMLCEADIIHFMVGTAVNDAHEDLVFKQAGLRVRATVITLIADKLRDMGKTVVEQYY